MSDFERLEAKIDELEAKIDAIVAARKKEKEFRNRNPDYDNWLCAADYPD